MAVSAADHLAQAIHNERLLDHLINSVVPNQPEFTDWALTVMFYAALHYAAGGLMRDKGEIPEGHHGTYRDKAGNLHHGMVDLVSKHYGADVAPSYAILYGLSREARYGPLYAEHRNGKEAVRFLTLNRVHLEIVKAACV